MKSSWHVGATELGSCWQKVFRLAAVNILQIALNCHIEDLGLKDPEDPCPKGKKKKATLRGTFTGTQQVHSNIQEPQLCAHCPAIPASLPGTQHQHLVLKFKIECPESIQLKTYINVQWEQKD